jgi:iron complex transport system ATP-binding protein
LTGSLLEFTNVSVARGLKTVLHNINFKIAPGEHVAILGPNGSGKSTLIKTITRECYPLIADGSSLRILGRDRWNVFELRSLLGIVSNDLTVTCSREISVEEAILSGFFSSIGLQTYHRLTPAMQEKASEVIDLLKIGHLRGRWLAELSSGEARRVVIGRALVHSPLALLLDEPANSLDLFAMQELRQTICALAHSGIGIMLVTHHLPDVIPEIDRVIFLKDGRIEADGPKTELLTAERLSDLFCVNLQLIERDGYFHLC